MSNPQPAQSQTNPAQSTTGVSATSQSEVNLTIDTTPLQTPVNPTPIATEGNVPNQPPVNNNTSDQNPRINWIVVLPIIFAGFAVATGIINSLLTWHNNQISENARELEQQKIQQDINASKTLTKIAEKDQKATEEKLINDRYDKAREQILTRNDGLVISGINTIKEIALKSSKDRWEFKEQLRLIIRNNSRTAKDNIKKGDITTTSEIAIKAIKKYVDG